MIARLARDEAGNALMLTAAAMIPLLAMVGSGIDVGRTYVAHSRLQQACDAASLAGRWAVSAGSDTTHVQSESVKYFNFNYPQGSFGTAAFTPAVAITGSTTKAVTVTASTTIPMSVMKVFGYATLPLSVTCSSQQDFVNTDIVLVLDTTGSMTCLPSDSDSTCSSWIAAHPGSTGTSIVRSTSRLQGLRDAVMALYDQLSPIQTQLEAAGMRLRFSVVPYASTVNVGKLLYAQNTGYIRNPAPYQKCTASYYGTCYAASPQSVTHNAAWFAAWPGCIEERQTTTSLTASSTSIPSSAYDLDLDTIPTNAATQWAPYDTGSETANTQTACPYGAVRMQAWSRAALQTYVNLLYPDGGTYHDIGMIWGGRMISSGGVFADSPTSYNGMPTNKFMIFMTDGYLDTGPTLYSAYGVEKYDQRVTGGDLSSQDARHQQRFNLMCSRVKNAGTSIWVVAFASGLDSNLTNCASNPGQASTSSNSSDLIAKFTQIGKAIGALRLTQ